MGEEEKKGREEEAVDLDSSPRSANVYETAFQTRTRSQVRKAKRRYSITGRLYVWVCKNGAFLKVKG